MEDGERYILGTLVYEPMSLGDEKYDNLTYFSLFCLNYVRLRT